MINRKTMLQRRFANGFNKTEVSYPLALENAIERKAQNYKLFGNCRQETRSGKNLLNNTGVNRIVNGISLIIDDDGTCILNGTATGNAFFTINNGLNLESDNIILNGCPDGGSISNYLLRATYLDNTYTDETGSSQILNSGKIISKVEIRIGNGYTATNLIFKPMLSTTGGEYEQYGVSPSPDYPSEILSLGDLQTEGEHAGKYKIEYQSNSRQLLNLNAPTSTLNGQKITNNNNGTIKINGKTTRAFRFNLSDECRLEIGKTYTAYVKIVSGEFSPYMQDANWILLFYPSNNESERLAPIEANIVYKKTFVATSNEVPFLWFGFNARTTEDYAIANDLILEFQIEEGSTAHSYVPYSNDTITLYLDKPLMAIKSTSANYNLKIGDNYYVADYLDFERQKVVRNYNEIEIEIISTTVWHNEYWANIPKHLDAYSYNNFKAEKIVCECAICNENRVIGTLSSSANNKVYALYIKNGTTLEEIKTKVDGKKMFYQLATPIEEDIVLPDLHTVNGTTVITANTETQPLAIECSYSSKEV